MYLRISCYCDACLNSSDLRVGVTTLLNTIQRNMALMGFQGTVPAPKVFTVKPGFLWCFRVPKISKNYHRIPRIREIVSLQVHTRHLAFSLKKTVLN